MFNILENNKFLDWTFFFEINKSRDYVVRAEYVLSLSSQKLSIILKVTENSVNFLWLVILTDCTDCFLSVCSNNATHFLSTPNWTNYWHQALLNDVSSSQFVRAKWTANNLW